MEHMKVLTEAKRKGVYYVKVGVMRAKDMV